MAPLRNLRHENFCQLMLQAPKRGWSNAEVYRQSGYRAEGNGAEVNASKLLSPTKIQQRIAELNAPAVRKARVTVESLLAELDATVQAARAAKQFGAVNGALTLVGKLTGLLRDRLEVGAPSDFALAETPDEVVSRMIEDWGAQEALRVAELIKRLIEERASGRALDVMPTRQWPSMIERRRALG